MTWTHQEHFGGDFAPFLLSPFEYEQLESRLRGEQSRLSE